MARERNVSHVTHFNWVIINISNFVAISFEECTCFFHTRRDVISRDGTFLARRDQTQNFHHFMFVCRGLLARSGRV